MLVATKLRRGMIFTRIRVGKLSNLEPWENPCVIFPCFIQPPQLRIAGGGWGSYCFGSGVVGLPVLSHMHTPPVVDFTMAKKPPPSLQWTQDCTLPTTLKKFSCTLHYAGLMICCSSSCRSRSCSRSRTGSSHLYSRSSSSTNLWMVWPYHFHTD